MKHKGLFFFILFLIIIAGGLVFYFGWIQIQLEENTYAVIFTKLNGYDEEITEPGTFTWRWDRLLPTNMTIHEFTLRPQEKEISLSGTLPSSDSYSLYLEGAPDFSYSLSFRISFTVRPESLPELVTDYHVTPDTIGSWYEDIFSRCLIEASALLEEGIRDASEGTGTLSVHASLGSDLLNRLSSLYPLIEFHSAEPLSFHLPDFDLYRKGKEMYLSLMSEKEAAESAALKASSDFYVSESVRLDMLKKYGELLTEYPILLDYMKLSGVTDLMDIDIEKAVSEVE